MTKISNLCPSCREPLNYSSGDGCAAMTLHKEDEMDSNEAVKILNDFVMSDSFDDLISYRLEKSLRWTMEDLTRACLDTHNLDDLVEWFHYCRSLVNVLESFTTNDYSDTTKELNRIEDELKGVYL